MNNVTITNENAFVTALNAICEKIGLAVDWTSENILPYAQDLCGRFITYQLVMNIIWLIMSIISIFIAIKLFKIGANAVKIMSSDDYDYDNEGWYIFQIIAGFFGTAIFGLPGALNIISYPMDIVKCLTIPEIYLIETLQTLIK